MVTNQSGPEPWDLWIQAIRCGDERASREFWDRYAVPLLNLAAKNLQARLRRRVDPEDVVQSAFRTALRRIQRGEFRIDSDDDLWRLLCAITLNKSRHQARLHQQQKRAQEREIYIDDQQHTPASWSPTPDDAVALVDLVEEVMKLAATDEHRDVLRLKLDGFSNREIALELSCSERTVRRICEHLRQSFDQLLER